MEVSFHKASEDKISVPSLKAQQPKMQVVIHILYKMRAWLSRLLLSVMGGSRIALEERNVW